MRARQAAAVEPLTEVLDALRARRGRRALELLKSARSAKAEPACAELLRYVAYSLREGELQTAGLTREAAAILPLRLGCQPSATAVAAAPPAAQRLYLHCAPAEHLVQLLPQVDADARRVLADRVMTAPGSMPMAALRSLAPLSPAGDAIAAARGHMQQGQWAAAAQALSGIERTDPFAGWRLFCRAMAARLAGDANTAARYAAQVPVLAPDFLLMQAVLTLVDAGPTGKTDPRRRPAITACLEPEAQFRADAQLVLQNQKGGRRADDHSWLEAVRALGQSLTPDDGGVQGTQTLLAALSVGASVTAERRLMLATKRMGNDALAARLTLLMLLTAPGEDWPAAALAVYLERLPTEFPEPAQTALALGQMLFFMAQRLRRHGDMDEDDEQECLEELAHVLPQSVRTQDKSLAGVLLEASLRADPNLRPAYAALLALLPQGSSAQRTVLAVQVRQFPDDHAALLQLLRLQLAAPQEVAVADCQPHLARALALAPQDPGTQLLRTVVQARLATEAAQRQDPEATLQAFRDAYASCAPDVMPYLQAKELLEGFNAGILRLEALETSQSHFEAVLRLRRLALLNAQLTAAGAKRTVKRSLVAEANALTACSSAEARALLEPLAPDLGTLFAGQTSMLPGLVPVLPKVLKQLDHADLLAAMAHLARPATYRPLMMDCSRRLRLRGRCRDQSLDLNFLRAALKMLDLPSRGAILNLSDLSAPTDAPTRARLQAIARSLVPGAPAPAQPLLRDLHLLRREAMAENDEEDDEDEDEEDGPEPKTLEEMVEHVMKVMQRAEAGSERAP